MSHYQFLSNTPHSETEIRSFLVKCSKNDWLVSIEYSPVNSDENTYWQTWPLSMVDAHFPDLIFEELERCHTQHPDCFVMICAHSQEDHKYRKVAQMLAFGVDSGNRDANCI
ncbi:MAG: ribulose bisphosphate carboxylase small subunit [Gammaproteobacteria bacterium]|nr:ribulose bisphosphate carboxylase small subunit [Gammaproteobacteria bacterium]